jgi:hypothetical protein
MTSISNPDEWFSYNTSLDILICIPCGTVVMPGRGGGVRGHLEYAHHAKVESFALSVEARRELCELHRNRLLNPTPLLPSSCSNPVEHLPVYVGLACKKCPYVCHTLSNMELHSRKDHGWSKRAVGKLTPHPYLYWILII